MRVIGEKTVDKGSAWGTFEHEYLSRQLFLAGPRRAGETCKTLHYALLQRYMHMCICMHQNGPRG